MTKFEEIKVELNILENCVDGGGFALGVGNWAADTIPFENYLAMLEEARMYR